jgi:mono/diheme cytochrome c family protein
VKKFYFVFFVVAICCTACESNSVENTNENTASVSVPNTKNGKQLFQQICSSCHGISASENKTSAPILENLKSKWPDAIALNSFIKNAPEAMQKSAYTIALYSKWKSNIQMPPYIGMSDQEIADLVAYLYSL